MKQEKNPRSLFFRARLCALIAERGISQRELAAATDLTPQSVSNYVRGTRSLPGAEELYALAKYFQVTMESLLGPVEAEGGLREDKKIITASTKHLKLRRIAKLMERTAEELNTQVGELKTLTD